MGASSGSFGVGICDNEARIEWSDAILPPMMGSLIDVGVTTAELAGEPLSGESDS